MLQLGQPCATFAMKGLSDFKMILYELCWKLDHSVAFTVVYLQSDTSAVLFIYVSITGHQPETLRSVTLFTVDFGALFWGTDICLANVNAEGFMYASFCHGEGIL